MLQVCYNIKKNKKIIIGSSGCPSKIKSNWETDMKDLNVVLQINTKNPETWVITPAELSTFYQKEGEPTDKPVVQILAGTEHLRYMSLREGTILMTPKCANCAEIVPFRVWKTDLELRKKGAMIQNAFPYVTADKRELLVSGLCGKCFDKIMSEPR